MIKAIFLDIDNTLLDFDKCAKSSIILCCEKFNLKYNDDIFYTFKKVTRSVWDAIGRGEITKEELHNIRWKIVFEELNITGINPLKFEDEFRYQLFFAAEEVEGATDIVKYLYNKYPLYIATNAPRNQQEERLKRAGLLQYMTDIFVSEEIGSYKPQKEYFNACFCKMPPVAKDEVLFIGDEIFADIEGSLNYGIKACWFNIYNQEKPDNLNPDYIITRLEQLKNIL